MAKAATGTTVKLNYQLNHPKTIEKSIATISDGDSYAESAGTIVIFDRTVALANEIKRIPILRSLNIKIIPGVNISNYHDNANVTHNIQRAKLYLTPFQDDTKKLGEAFVNSMRDTTNNVYHCDMGGANHYSYLGGGYPLPDKIYYYLTNLTESATSGADFTGYTAIFFLELDWIPVSQKQWNEYMMEFLGQINY